MNVINIFPNLSKKNNFKFIQVSTDEVFGSLGNKGTFNEKSSYNPSSPYSASKASADHLVKAWNKTYNFPSIITNCSNNYGPFQFPEKLIPLIILSAIQEKSLPVYGKGLHVRDWLHVDDHARALKCIAEKGVPGETYNIGGSNEKKNIDVVKKNMFNFTKNKTTKKYTKLSRTNSASSR